MKLHYHVITNFSIRCFDGKLSVNAKKVFKFSSQGELDAHILSSHLYDIKFRFIVHIYYKLFVISEIFSGISRTEIFSLELTLIQFNVVVTDILFVF